MNKPCEKTEEFALSARRLCNALENPPSDRQEAAALFLRLLSEVYALALSLEWPGDDFGESDLSDSFPVSNEVQAKVFENVASVFGERRYYWLQFDPIFPRDESGEPVVADLADDFGDIYRDILPALLAWEAGADRFDDILFEWRATPFESHWGIHASHALHALHLIVFKHGVGAS